MSDKTKETLANIAMSIWVIYTVVSILAFCIIVPNGNYHEEDAKYMREVCDSYQERMDNWDKDQREIPEWLILEFYKMDAWIYEMEIVILDYDKWNAFGDTLHRGNKLDEMRGDGEDERIMGDTYGLGDGGDGDD